MSGWLQGALVLAGGIVTVNAAIGVISAVTDRTIGRRRLAYARLRQLAAHAHIEYFTSILGPPALIRSNLGWVERVWVDRAYYFVQAFTDDDERVVLFSVTSRSTNFRPEVPFPNSGRYTADPSDRLAAALQATKFSATGSSPSRIIADLAARRYGYVEIFWRGNPANYQAVALSVSDAAPSIGTGVPLDELHTRQQSPSGIELTADELHRFRAAEAPNTYTVTAPDVSLDGFPPIASVFGANADDVRVFP